MNKIYLILMLLPILFLTGCLPGMEGSPNIDSLLGNPIVSAIIVLGIIYLYFKSKKK